MEQHIEQLYAQYGSPHTIICRCEEITLQEIIDAVTQGCASISAIKRYSRAGMGPCQGRGCAKHIANILHKLTEKPLADIAGDTVRFPSLPVPIQDLSSIGEGPDVSSSIIHPLCKKHSTYVPPVTKTEVIIIGGGYHGCSIAWQLAKKGVPTVLIESHEIGTGASGNNFGCVQLQDSNISPTLDLNLRGFRRMSTIESEFDADISYRQKGSLLLAHTEEELNELEKQAKTLAQEGIHVALLTPKQVLQIEPHLCVDTLLGASYMNQAIINPFRYIRAMINQAQKGPFTLLEHQKVVSIETSARACCGVFLDNGHFIEAKQIVVAAGAWTKSLCESCGIFVPIHYVVGEAFVSESLPIPTMHNFLSSASFFTTTHASSKRSTSFTATQTESGNMLIGETGTPHTCSPDRVIHRTTSHHCSEVPIQLAHQFPSLTHISVLRSWTTCSPSTENFEPFLGSTEIDGLLLASGFKSSVVISSVVGEIISDLIISKTAQYDKSFYDKNYITLSKAWKGRSDLDENK